MKPILSPSLLPGLLLAVEFYDHAIDPNKLGNLAGIRRDDDEIESTLRCFRTRLKNLLP